MKTKEITTIVFDLGNVLIDWNPQYVFRTIFDDEAEMDHFLKNICTSDWNELHDAGQDTKVGTEQLVAKHPEYETAIRAFYGRWEEMLGGPIHGTVEILRQLKQEGKYRLLALTNWSQEFFPIALRRYGFLQLFEGIVVSGVEKMIKPNPKFYQVLFDRYEVAPAEAIFIDDNPKNIKGSAAVGMRAIQFESPKQLKEELENLGILA